MATNKYEATFTIDEIGETTGDKFPGVFKVKTRLSFRDALERDKIRRALLGEQPEGASVRAANISEIFSELAVRIVDAPSWWTNSSNGMDLSDDNVIRAVADATMKAAAEAASALKKGADEAKRGLSKPDQE
jgi:hypothetical protein